MSGTSIDGVDAAIIATDGENQISFMETAFLPYPKEFRQRLKASTATPPPYNATLTRRFTNFHIRLARQLVQKLPQATQLDVIGFSGQTMLHAPPVSYALGDAAALADALGVKVVADLRQADLQNGGQGAPIVPLFHRALAHTGVSPTEHTAIVNIGGVANATLLKAGSIAAGDVGTGMGLVDEATATHFNRPFDEAGKIAASGKVCEATLQKLLAHRWFKLPLPKSLDVGFFRDFAKTLTSHLSPKDLVATLTAFTGDAIALAVKTVASPSVPPVVYCCGGGSKNRFLMGWLSKHLNAKPISQLARGLDGDFIEAQAFAWLAVRHLKDLPLTLPSTTGCRSPTKGGRLYLPA